MGDGRRLRRHSALGAGHGIQLPDIARSQLLVKDAGDGRSIVEWRGRCKRLAYWTDEPPAGQDDKAALDFLNGAYKNGLANLKKTLEAQDRQAGR